MTDSDALELSRIKLKVLGKAGPGDIVTLGADGRWSLVAPSSWAPWKSAFRKIVALFTQTPLESQRQAFLNSAKATVNGVIGQMRLLMKTSTFTKATDESGMLTLQPQKLTATDLNDLEVLLETIQAVCGDLWMAGRGLENVLKHPSYTDDLTFCSEVAVSLTDPINQFLQQTHRKLGPLGPRMMPYLTKAPPSAPSSSTPAMPSGFMPMWRQNQQAAESSSSTAATGPADSALPRPLSLTNLSTTVASNTSTPTGSAAFKVLSKK